MIAHGSAPPPVCTACQLKTSYVAKAIMKGVKPKNNKN